MRFREVFFLFTLSVVVNGSLWAAAVQPVILSLGAMMAAVDQDLLDVHLFDWNWKKWFQPKSNDEKKEKETKRDENLTGEKINDKSGVEKEEEKRDDKSAIEKKEAQNEKQAGHPKQEQEQKQDQEEKQDAKKDEKYRNTLSPEEMKEFSELYKTDKYMEKYLNDLYLDQKVRRNYIRKISMGLDDMEALIFPAHFGNDYMADYIDEF